MIVPEVTSVGEAHVLGSREVHVRSLRLEQPASVCDDFAAVLSADERARAARFVFERDRREFIVCRGALRVALGGYLGEAPASLTFAYGERGKPALREHPELHFNVSHASGLGVFAFARTGPVGVDVECLGRTVDFAQLATRFFCAEEAAELLSLAPHARAEAFFNCWTRKEAYIKAVGDGLACPLDSFAVTLVPGERARIKWIATDEAASWRVDAFVPAPTYVAAIALRSASAIVNCREWRAAAGTLTADGGKW